jgi:phosphopantothenoylcysteine decarboxylase/phosphopantothenate--cysteine ligase
MSKFLFKLSGSIAAYKACALISRLVQEGHTVQTVASPAALQFVGAATLEGLTGRAVITDIYAAGNQMDHIHLNRWADAVLLCPATARTLNHMAAGTGDEPLASFFLAHDFSTPYFVVPAMNQAMYAHPATQHALNTLKGWGIRIIEGKSGIQACGEHGLGRMAEPDEIYIHLQQEKLV